MMPSSEPLPSILRVATHAKASHLHLSSFARAVLFNLALAEILQRLRRPAAGADDLADIPRVGVARGLGRAMLSEGLEMVLVDMRWQRRRVAAAIDRAAAATSVADHPVLTTAAPSVPAQRRAAHRRPAVPAGRAPISR